MLHSSYKGVNLAGKQLDTADEWITMKYPSLPPFPFFTNVASKLSAINWWNALLRSYVVPADFLELAVTLPSCPTSST